MKISVFGLGYVGCVTAACLADLGHDVLGVDVVPEKVAAINRGRSPIVERGIEAIIQRNWKARRLAATQHGEAGVRHGEICLICVGTPSNPNGSLNLSQVERVCIEIGQALRTVTDYRVVVLRSTVLPGTVSELIIPLLERLARKQLHTDFGIALNPEFLREGSAIRDFQNPPFTLIGASDNEAYQQLAQLYETIPAEILCTDPDTACMVKYASNAFHALKIVFANEIGQLCKAVGINGSEVMDIFRHDDQLNISTRYLRPGFAFGGSCLPKDLRALTYQSRHMDVNLPVLESILPSNTLQIKRVVDRIRYAGRKRIALLGLSFKPDTDDLRESPFVRLAEELVGKGYKLRIYDANVSYGRLTGSNLAFIEKTLPHLAALLANSLEEALEDAELIVAGHGVDDELLGLISEGQILIDLGHLPKSEELPVETAYEGMSW